MQRQSIYFLGKNIRRHDRTLEIDEMQLIALKNGKRNFSLGNFSRIPRGYN